MTANEQRKVFKICQILGVLERCFGTIAVPMSVLLDRVSDQWVDFYYAKLVDRL